MRKILLTLNSYPQGHEMNNIFNENIKPNFEKYCEIHEFEMVIIKENLSNMHIHWTKIIWILNNWGNFNEGDIITYIDSDSLIIDLRYEFVFSKSFAIPLESTGVLCMGFFSIHICDYIKEFLNKMISFAPDCNIYFNDNHAFYLALNKEMGSNELDNCNIQILPTNYNVTVNPDDFKGELEKHEKIIINLFKKELFVPKDEIIIRHFAGGQIYKPYVKNYVDYYENKIYIPNEVCDISDCEEELNKYIKENEKD